MKQDLKVRIESLAYGGSGVAHTAEGRVIFVAGACPGDEVSVRVTAEHPRYLEGEIVQLLQPSPDRVEPPCPYFETCGGCQWQQVAYETQVHYKRLAVIDALERIGRISDPEVQPAITSPARLGYRNKVELTVGPEGRFSLGYTGKHDRSHVPIAECLLLPERWRTAPRSLTGSLSYASRGADLGLKRVALRASEATGDVEIALWGPPGTFPSRLAARTLRDGLGATSITRVLTKGDVKERRVTKVEVLAGRGHWRERLGSDEMIVSAPSFFQVNTAAAALLVEAVMECAGVTGSDTVAEIYAGVGTLTLPLARATGMVLALESSGHALRDLRRNLEAAGVDVEIVPGDAGIALPSVGHFDVAIVDPPRAGLSPDVLSALTAGRPRRIVYVSCDPSTLARDVAALSPEGYRLASATPVDLFPQTYHVETVATIDRV